MVTCFIRERGSGTRTYQERALSQLNLSPYLVKINSTSLIKNMIHANNGFSIVSKSILTPYDIKNRSEKHKYCSPFLFSYA